MVLNYIDFYKTDHRRQYPEGTQLVFSNFTPRSTRTSSQEVVFFGLQYFLKEYLINRWNEEFFNYPKEIAVARYEQRMNSSLGPGAIQTQHIEALHDLGFLPIAVLALPEGSIVNLRIPCMVLYNTHPEFFWLTNYLETILSCILWGPCTSATTAHCYHQLLSQYAEQTNGDTSFVQWQGHDFSFRGMFGLEAAQMSGAGHLLSFTGTDTIPAIDFLEKYYSCSSKTELIGGSVPATEHSVMSMGMESDELKTFKRLITEVYPSGIVSIVSDTWDFWRVLTEYLPKLKKDIEKREGKVVIRPDSGDPVKIICGDPDAPKGSPENKGAIECLYDVFGGTVTEKGFIQLNPCIGLIYGDSITFERCEAICAGLKKKGFASTNVVLGIGSYTYQYVTRDTYGFAMKATYGEVHGEGKAIWKDPKTDSGEKKSAVGLLAVYESDSPFGGYTMIENATWDQVQNCAFKMVFKNSQLYIDQSLSEIRQRLVSEGNKRRRFR